MRSADCSLRKLVLICQNLREDGRNCCMARGAGELYPVLKQAIKDVTTDVRVSRTGCLGCCASGPTVVIMPDNIWLGEVTLDDVPSIVEMVRD